MEPYSCWELCMAKPKNPVEAIASRLEAIAIRLEAIVIRFLKLSLN